MVGTPPTRKLLNQSNFRLFFSRENMMAHDSRGHPVLRGHFGALRLQLVHPGDDELGGPFCSLNTGYIQQECMQ